MNKPSHIVAFTGHRSYAGEADDALHSILEELYERGARIFRVGMAKGFDLHAGDITLRLKALHPDIVIEAYIPWPGFDTHLTAEEHELYNTIIAEASVIRYAAYYYSREALLRRNDMLIEGCNTLVAWCKRQRSGTGYTLNRAKRHGTEIINCYTPEAEQLTLGGLQ